MPELKIANDSDAVRWNDFVQKHGTIFHLFEWSKVLQTYSYSPRFYFLEDDGKIGSILPCVLTKKKRLVSLPFADYITLDSPKIVQEVWLSCKAEGLTFEHYSTENYAVSNLDSSQFAYTFEIDLSRGLEELWENSFTKKMRNQIRKAEKEGVKVRLVDDPQGHADEYYRLYLKTMKRIGALPHTKNFIGKAFFELQPYVRLFSADLADRTIGFLLTFAYKGRMHVWGNVSDPEFLWSSPNNLLYYTAMRECVTEGLSKIDFGSTQAGSGHAHFKDSFGGEQRPIYRISNTPYVARNHPVISRFLISLPLPVSQRLIGYIFASLS